MIYYFDILFPFKMKYLLIGNSNAMRASNIFITKDHALHKERRILKCTSATQFKLQVKIKINRNIPIYGNRLFLVINRNMAWLNLAIDLLLALDFVRRSTFFSFFFLFSRQMIFYFFRQSTCRVFVSKFELKLPS